ncbi:hypothetical protein [Streptomyces sp. MUSC 14]|uniref:hypothetical protein n=1 Tax=Streptomyces sp. MUSC 14 TaxID=1354889 RepID=UPI003526F526
MVPSPDRYGRSLQDLVNMVAELLGVSPGTLRADAVPRQLEAPTRQANPNKIVLTGISCTPTTHTRSRGDTPRP